MKKSKKLIVLIKVVITFILLYYLFKNLSINDLSEVTKISSLTLLSALLLHVLTILLCVYRWQLILKGLSIQVTFLKSLELTMIGLFFNNFLPSSVGGDAYKVYYFSKNSDTISKSLLSTLIDRISGLIGAIMLTFFFGILYFSQISKIIKNQLNIQEWWFLIILAVIIAIIILFYTLKKQFFKDKLTVIQKFLSDFFQFFKSQGITVIQSIAISLLFNVTICLSIYLIINNLENQTLKFQPLLLLVPAISLAAILPISINSIGVTEYLAVLLFPIFGFTSKIVLFSFLTWRFIGMFISLIGGILFLFQRKTANQ